MTVFVDDVRLPYGRMIMCHCWAHSLDELFEMVDRIGVARKWLQRPPKASWVHFDISLAKKALALDAGAVLTDQFEPAAHVARLTGNARMLDVISKARARRGLPADGILRASLCRSMLTTQAPVTT